MMLITVTEDSPVRYEGSVTVVTGTDQDGNDVTFAGDTRAMGALIEAAQELGEVTAYIEGWQVLYALVSA